MHFYLYSSLHIAICAMAITAYSYLTLPTTIDYSYVKFVGASTLLLYSIHRIIGIKKSDNYASQGRFAIIIKYKSHLIAYSILSATYCAYAYYTFDWNRRLSLVIPAVLSLSYSLPIFWGGKRLRDFHWIKIFLIAICWAVITCTIPYFEIIISACDTSLTYHTIILTTIERAMFIFAITIPFDIRDREIDKSINVFTLATRFDDRSLKRISWLALIIASIISILLYSRNGYTSIIFTYFITAYLIYLSNEQRSDYFFTGIIDGCMLLPILILWFYTITVPLFGSF